jgi:chemotaxis signal transduction protein
MRVIVPFRVQQTWVAVDAAHVREVLGERAWFQVPSGTPQIPGILAWQGRAIALFDLGALGGGTLVPLQPRERRPRTLVVHVSDALLALPVDGVMEVEEVDDSRVQPCHVTRLANCTTEVELRGRPMPLLNLSETVNGILASPA